MCTWPHDDSTKLWGDQLKTDSSLFEDWPELGSGQKRSKLVAQEYQQLQLVSEDTKTDLTVMRIPFGTHNAGWLIGIERDRADVLAASREVNQYILTTAIVVSVIAVFTGLTLSILWVKPIKKLARAADAVRGGDYSARVQLKRKDELGDMAQSFNEMADELTRITELEKDRALAHAANQSKSAFLANMSHEIRTPLTAILGFTDLLRDDGDTKLDPEKRIQAIDTISNAGEHLLSLINDILDLSKIEADKLTVECIDTPLISLVQGVESLMRPVAIGKGLSLSTTLVTPVPEQILSDPTRLRQILMNLVGNAIKFTEDGSVSIAVSTMDRDGATKLVIDIEDTGVGMSKDQSAQLFQAFGQADETMTRRFGGSGLGLTICRRFANKMGGDVKILRTEPGKGSCFRLIIPFEAVEGTAMVTSFDVVHNSSARTAAVVTTKLSGRILLAEDGIDNQRLIEYHLKKGGAEVIIADNGKIALEMIDKADADGVPFDLLLTDMQMPEMDGYTLASTLRERGSTLAIVALTAHAMAEDQVKCIDAGCDDYASKPINNKKLLAVCAKWIGKTGSSGGCKKMAYSIRTP